MKTLRVLIICSSLLLLAACGNDDDKDKVTNPPNNAPAENNNGTDATDTTDTNDSTDQSNQNQTNIPFTSFDLDVDYANFKSFEVEYENESDGMEAKLEDELNTRKIRGDEAFAEMQSRFQQFKFDQNTSVDEVIDEVLKSFNLKSDFKKFDLEIKFADGTEKEYQKTQ